MVLNRHTLTAGLLILGYMHISALETLYLSEIKNDATGPLMPHFLSDLAHKTKATVFFETGTWYGGTTRSAISAFSQIYTVELSQKLYGRACDIFKDYKKIHCYFGDSPTVLNNVLPTIKDKIVFWLDAHECGGLSAHSDYVCPVILELRAIKDSGITNATILIDDVRLFNPVFNWPTIQQVKEEILAINPAYNVEIFGDTMLAYLPNDVYTISPFIHACTLSALFDCPQSNLGINDLDIVEAEKMIPQATAEEAYAIERIANKMAYIKYPLLWTGLIAYSNHEFEKSYTYFFKAYNAGLNHWRISWYMAQASFEMQNYKVAHKHVADVRTQAPYFIPAITLEQQITQKI